MDFGVRRSARLKKEFNDLGLTGLSRGVKGAPLVRACNVGGDTLCEEVIDDRGSALEGGPVQRTQAVGGLESRVGAGFHQGFDALEVPRLGGEIQSGQAAVAQGRDIITGLDSRFELFEIAGPRGLEERGLSCLGLRAADETQRHRKAQCDPGASSWCLFLEGEESHGWVFSGSLSIFDEGDQGVVDPVIAGDHFSATFRGRVPIAIGHTAAGFLDQE